MEVTSDVSIDGLGVLMHEVVSRMGREAAAVGLTATKKLVTPSLQLNQC
jgi:hypothetical protein